MSRPDPLQPATRLNDPLHLLEPLGAAVSAVAQPGALAIGLGLGATVGALGGLALGLAFIRSPAALGAIPLAAILILLLWSCALGASALISDRASDERDTSAGRALRDAWRQVPALALAALVGDPAEPLPEVDPFTRTAGAQSSAPSAGPPAAAQPAAASGAPASAGSAASPRARRLAEELGVDLGTVTGTGPGGKITDRDVQRTAGR